jgi:hypothetical protein
VSTPYHFFEFVGPCTVVREKTPLVSSHTQMVNEESAYGRWVGGWVERAAVGGIVGLQEIRNISVQISHFPGDSAYHFSLVRREVLELLGSFGMLNLQEVD